MTEIKVTKPWNAGDYNEDAFIILAGAKLPDEMDTVVRLELDETAL
jgi:alpha-L-fucosidase